MDRSDEAMQLLVNIIVGFVLVVLLVMLLTKLMALTAAALIGVVPALIMVWFVIMILRSMVMSLFK